MAQSTPTHASGFHLVTVAMTCHVEEMDSTTVAHSSLKCVVLNAVKRAEARTWDYIDMIKRLVACLVGQ